MDGPRVIHDLPSQIYQITLVGDRCKMCPRLLRSSARTDSRSRNRLITSTVKQLSTGWVGLGWVEEVGPTDKSAVKVERHMQLYLAVYVHIKVIKLKHKLSHTPHFCCLSVINICENILQQSAGVWPQSSTQRLWVFKQEIITTVSFHHDTMNSWQSASVQR